MSPPPAVSPSLPAPSGPPSLPEAHRSVALPASRHRLRRLFAFLGPGYLVAVGYMDPGNWATDIAGGSAFGYRLLWIVMLANLMAMLLQVLAARLGIVTGRDLAQACREHYPRPVARMQWVLCELAICATDLAEVLGMAIALQLLFGIPLPWGVALTTLDTFLLLWLQQRGFRWLEAFVMALIAIIFACFAVTLTLAGPDWGAVASGFIPTRRTVEDTQMLVIAIGILGATVMPHNLYLHSASVQTRRYALDDAGKREAIRYATLDTLIALTMALLINSAILVTAASVFHVSGHTDVARLQDAHHLLTPLLGTALASVLFGVALLASGQSSTLTATLAGQVVMEGFVRLKLTPWKRRLLTRAVALVPALVVIAIWGDDRTTDMLIWSQIALSLQLPFAVWPLVRFTSDPRRMGAFANPWPLRVLAWLVAAMLLGLNALLVLQVVRQLAG